MPSKCSLKKFEESIEDIKLIYEFYLENGGESIEEMISPVKYLLACISDIFNDGVNNDKGKEFYSVYEQFSRIEGIIEDGWDDFDKGLIWIIQKLNDYSLASFYERNYERLKPFYKWNSLIITKKQEILNLLKELEHNVKFNLYQEDLYVTRIRFKPKKKEKEDDKPSDKLSDKSSYKSSYKQSEKSPISEESLASPVVYADVMNSSFISMEAIDVKLLQEREMRNDFGFLNKLKYNSIRLVNNFRVSNMKPMRSDFRVDGDGDFESINIFSLDTVNICNEIEKMEICPERGLISQNYSCIECGNGISSKDSIKCDFSGNYLCPKCHGGKQSINPIRIVRNWDFKVYPISNESRKIIANISYNELINFPKINPKEFKTNEKFKPVQKLREKIFKSTQKRLKAVGKTEAAKQLRMLEKLAWPKTHLLTSIDLYTIEDLIEIERETFFFIVGYCRTPLGVAFTGSLSHLSAPELASHAIKGCLTKFEVLNGLKVKAKDLIEEVYLGHVVSAGCGQAPATQAIRLAGLPTTIPATTVNKVCASGMKAVSLAAAMIKSGNANCILAGGMESMSSAPFTIPTQLRCPNRGLRFGNSELTDLLAKDGLIDAETGLPMGEAAERIAEAHGISRQEMEEYSKGTFARAIESKHLFESEEIISIPSPSNPNSLIIEDDGPKTFKPEKFASLRTPFRPENGRVTAATSSQLTDGAAVMLLMSQEMVKELGITPMAKIVAWADSGVEDAMKFPIAPTKAVAKCYKSANLTESEIDLHEINEAFAVVPLAVSRLSSIPIEKINILGGSVALGHPLGASGARIIGTLMTALKSSKKKRGCASICNGGGGSSAIIIELCKEGSD